MEYLQVGDKITLICRGSCPRKRKYTLQKGDENTFPKGTVFVKSKCPWHEDGDFDEEDYFDKDMKQLFWQPPDYA